MVVIKPEQILKLSTIRDKIANVQKVVDSGKINSSMKEVHVDLVWMANELTAVYQRVEQQAKVIEEQNEMLGKLSETKNEELKKEVKK